jgi:hypothetical protein
LDDDFDLPEGPDLDEVDDDDGSVGVDDAEDLLLSELRDGEPEDVGLDTESTGSESALVTSLLDIEDEESDTAADEGALDIDDEIDAEGEEHGWTEGSEGSGGSEPWDDDMTDELGEQPGEDGGEEGVDDPLLDSLPEELQRPRVADDDDGEGVVDDSMEDLVRDIGEGV